MSNHSTDYGAYETGPTTCFALNSSLLLTNTSDTSDGAYVKVTCVQGYQLSALHAASGPYDVFRCMGTIWYPSSPRCISAPPDAPIGIIAGCTVGGVVCLLVILAAIYMLYRSRGEQMQEKQNDLLQKAKIIHLNFFMSSFQQDNVGMPAVTTDSVDCDLRGVKSMCSLTPDASSSDQNTQGTDLQFQEYEPKCSLSRRSSLDSITSAGDLEAQE